MKTKVWKSILVGMLTALAVFLVSCDDLVSSSSSSSGSKANPGHLGESFTLPTGEIWDWPAEGRTVEARFTTQERDRITIATGAVAGGMFPDLEIREPTQDEKAQMRPISDLGDDIDWSNPDARIAILELIVRGEPMGELTPILGEIYRECYDWEEDDDGNDIFEEIIDVEWWYVTADTSFQGDLVDDECEDEDECDDECDCEDDVPLAVNLDLRQGWNRVVTRFYESESREEATMTVAAEPAGVYWQYDED